MFSKYFFFVVSELHFLEEIVDTFRYTDLGAMCRKLFLYYYNFEPSPKFWKSYIEINFQ